MTHIINKARNTIDWLFEPDTMTNIIIIISILAVIYKMFGGDLGTPER